MITDEEIRHAFNTQCFFTIGPFTVSRCESDGGCVRATTKEHRGRIQHSARTEQYIDVYLRCSWCSGPSLQRRQNRVGRDMPTATQQYQDFVAAIRVLEASPEYFVQQGSTVNYCLYYNIA